jgi:hypothetical protein
MKALFVLALFLCVVFNDAELAPYLHQRGLVTPANCKFMEEISVNYTDIAKGVSGGNSYWDGKIIPHGKLETLNKQAYDLTISMIEESRVKIREFFKLTDDSLLYLDLATVTRWIPGMELGMHADNTFWPSRQPNYVPHRTYTAVYYFSDPSQYKGGDFYFLDKEADRQVVVPLQAGDMVAISAGLDHVHGVSKLESGLRVVFTIWFRSAPVSP